MVVRRPGFRDVVARLRDRTRPPGKVRVADARVAEVVRLTLAPPPRLSPLLVTD